MSVCESLMSQNDDEIDFHVAEGDDDYGYEPSTSATRLSAFNKPKAASRKRQRIQKPTANKAKNKGVGKGRNFGKLAQLLNMPLDVFFEITSRLEPLDILQLSRVSKKFRSTFASQSARHIWVAARKNADGMPDCPPDLSEMQYASLVFEHNCQACGKSRAQKTDYSLRVRFCGPCYNQNVKKGSTIMRPYRNVPEKVLTLVPRAFLKSYHAHGFDAGSNSISGHFYVPEVDMVVRRWRELEFNHSALNQFEKRQLAIASEIMEHATALHHWIEACKCAKYDQDTQRSVNRESSIKQHLADLGYIPDDFPPYWDEQWSALINQPRELTPRIWKVIRPKLEASIEEEKKRRLKEKREERLVIRRSEFRPFWGAFATKMPSGLEKPLPTFSDACNLPTVVGMLADNDAYTTVTEERFLSREDAIISDIAEYQTNIKRELVKLLVERRMIDVDTQDGSNTEEVNLSVLDRATTLFKCCRIFDCRTLLPYPDIFEHAHVKELTTFSGRIWNLQPAGLDIKSTIVVLLKALGLPEYAPATAIDDLNGRLVCLCGHPRYRKPMDFGALVYHFKNENNWYNQAKVISTSKCVVVHNDHDLSSPPNIALLSSDELLSHDQANKTDDDTNDSSEFAKYCVICLQLTRSDALLRSTAEVEYHMKGKHLKEACEGDVVPQAQLSAFTH